VATVAASPFLIHDGGLATELERHGQKLHETLWSAYCLISDPSTIKKVHYEYLESGANFITTATYQASVDGFSKIGVDREKSIELFKLSVDLALEAKQEFMKTHKQTQTPIFIAASIGPYGAFLANGSEYTGAYVTQLNKQDFINFHFPRLNTLATHPDVDVVLCETLPCLVEAEYLAELLSQISPKVPVFISFSCKDDVHLCSGEKISDAIKALEKYPQDVSVGVNCTAPEYILGLICEIKSATRKPIIVYPNRGENWDATARKYIPHTDRTEPHFAELVRTWHTAGAKIIGGCCRTCPVDISAFKHVLTNLGK